LERANSHFGYSPYSSHFMEAIFFVVFYFPGRNWWAKGIYHDPDTMSFLETTLGPLTTRAISTDITAMPH
jgi:hypothetical protein